MPVVPVIHDLSHIRLPEAHPRRRVNRLAAIGALVAQAPAIVTVSEFSKQEIVTLLGVAPEKIVVAPPGVGAAFRDLSTIDPGGVARHHGLQPGQYFLAIGTVEPRKNLATLVAAFAELPAALRERYPLVLGGGAGWGDAGLRSATSERLRAVGQLRLLGYVPPGDLPGLYAGATAFSFPSLYEGFGMPVVEAMACATPVLASNVSAIPEAAGGAALLLPPRDVAAWTAALRRIIDDKTLAGTLRARGLNHAAAFTWENCARQILKAFALAHPARPS